MTDPTTVGSTKYGSKVTTATSGNNTPPPNTTPYAVRIGTTMRITIQEECARVSPSLAR